MLLENISVAKERFLIIFLVSVQGNLLDYLQL